LAYRTVGTGMAKEMQSETQKIGSTRSAILNKAADLFSDRGYAETSMADLAEDLGLSKAAIYHHFESKESILRNLVTTTIQEMGALVEEIEKLPANRVNPQEVLRRLAEIIFTHRRVVSLVLFQLPAEMRTQGIERRDYMLRLQKILAGKNSTLEDRMRAKAATIIIATGIVPPPFGKHMTKGETDLSLLVDIAIDALNRH
jgi:AcrR family transcriptional regulator